MLWWSSVQSSNVNFVISVGDATIPLEMVVRNIGVCLDSQLDTSAQMSSAFRDAHFHLFRIAD